MDPDWDVSSVVKNIKDARMHIIVIILYSLITIFATYPLIMHVSTGLEVGDPALNTWILAWDVHSIIKDPFNLFNANMFYPFTKNTLTFSEHLIADMLFAFPIIAITHNQILAYNLILILSFILSAYGMFLLINYHIENEYSAFIGGVIFAFCTIRFAHIGHLQFLTIQWLPFALLYLDKFLHKGNYKYLISLFIFSVLQVLSSWYLAFYTIICLGAYGICSFFINTDVRKNIFQRSFQIKSALLVIGAIIVIAPFGFPYLEVAHEYGFTRTLDEVSYYSADVADYFFTPPNNLIYGDLSKEIQLKRNFSEHSLFPGLSAVILALFGLFSLRKFRVDGANKYGLIYTGIAKQNVFVFILLLSFLLSLGYPLHFFHNNINIELPYKFFYEYFPGFKSMRVPSRFGILVMLALGVLASYGFKKLIEFKNFKFLISSFVVLLIIAENLYIPWSWGIRPMDDEVPDVYTWLANETGDFAIVELPAGSDSKYLYYSTFHWKSLVNGYSGFVPEGYQDIIRILWKFPSNTSINTLQSIGVKYVIIHMDEIDPNNASRIQRELLDYSDDISIKKIFNKDYVYEMNLTNSSINPFITVSGVYSTENWIWLQSNVSIPVYSEHNRTANLSLSALSFYKPRSIEIFIGDKYVAEVRANPVVPVEANIMANLMQGTNLIRITSPKDCDKPCDKPELGNSDCRCLGVAISKAGLK